MSTTSAPDLERELERLRPELVGYCYRMLASPFDAEDAVQETMLRAWRGADGFDGRSSLRTWAYRIATNACIDLAERRARQRALPMDLGPAREPRADLLRTPEVPWVEPMPDTAIARASDDPEASALRREQVRLAFVTAMQRLPARQRAVLVLREVVQLSAAEVAELLDTSEASVNSALQRARATLERSPSELDRASARATSVDPALLDRFVAAFERYDMAELEGLLRDDVVQSMPPFDLWLAGRDDVLAWWFGPGIACRGSRLVPAGTVGGQPALGQFKPSDDDPERLLPWALVVAELADDGLAAVTFFLDVERLFPLFDLPAELDAADSRIHR
jgi:RNA polymerase sigma-70 factor (ECF subfamily)